MAMAAPLTPQTTLRQADNILSDTTHVVHMHILNSRGRYRVPLCEHSRYRHSSIPPSVKLIDEQIVQDEQKDGKL